MQQILSPLRLPIPPLGRALFIQFLTVFGDFITFLLWGHSFKKSLDYA